MGHSFVRFKGSANQGTVKRSSKLLFEGDVDNLVGVNSSKSGGAL